MIKRTDPRDPYHMIAYIELFASLVASVAKIRFFTESSKDFGQKLEPYPLFCPRLVYLSKQLKEELAKFLGICQILP